MKRALIATIFFATPLFAQTVTGRFAPGEAYVAPERNAPPAVSRMFVRAADGQGVDLPATGQGGMIVVVNDRQQKTAKLRTPAGDSNSHSVQRFAVDAEGHEVLHIDQTMAGRYHVNGVGAGALVIAAEPDSRLTMTTTVGPLSRMPGDPLTLRATLRDGDDAITGAQLVAHLTSPDGKESDSIAMLDKGNGEYEATVAELPSRANGFWTVRYDADGVNARGVEFARTGSNQFMNERPSARLGDIHSRVENGVLHVTASADVLESGNYRFDVIVASRANAKGERHGVAWSESQRVLDAGQTELTIDIPVAGERAGGLFLDVRLLNLDSMGLAARKEALSGN